ncbi:MAG: methyltransferase type 12, partial [Verrucomicrobiae bacterium]|nr:methyltransferase type 12 [Verrucomicrobiae bacterium]
MIIHHLIRHHLSHGADAGFYALQARDAIRWLREGGVRIGPGVNALDLGCGSGVLGLELQREGCDVLFADAHNWLPDA